MKALPQTYTGSGLLDLQLNGYGGFDFNSSPQDWSAEQFHRIAGLLRRRGVLAALPTLITDDAAWMLERARRYGQLVEADAALAQAFPRLHVEGPFLSPVDGPRGAHEKAFCKLPAGLPEFLDQLQEASGGRIGILTLAPELPGALELIQSGSRQGVCMAIGHTQASADVLHQAVAAGARLSTHLGNGSHQMLPRLDNYIQSQLADDRLMASFIADGHHMPLTTLKNFIRAKTPARCILATDAIAAAEMPPGQYRLGQQAVEMRPDGRVCKTGQPNLAGSALTLDKAVINVFLHCDMDFEQAWAMASTQPAALLGMPPLPQVAVHISDGGFAAVTS